MPYFLFACVCGIWGTNFLLMKIAAGAFTMWEVALGRILGGAIMLVIFSRGLSAATLFVRGNVKAVLFLAMFGYVWPFSVQPFLVREHGSAFIGMTVSFVPLFTSLTARVMLGTHPSKRQFLGILGGLAFCGLLFGDALSRDVPWHHLLLAVSVPLGYAVTNTYVGTHFRNVPALTLTAASLLVGSTLAGPLAVALPNPTAINRVEWLWPLVALLTLGTVGTGCANWMFNKLIQIRGPLFASMITYVVPCIAVALGAILREQITAIQLLALAGILFMVLLVQYRPRQPAA